MLAMRQDMTRCGYQHIAIRSMKTTEGGPRWQCSLDSVSAIIGRISPRSGGITAHGASLTDVLRRHSRHHAGGPIAGPPVLFLPPGRCDSRRGTKKGVADGHEEDANDADHVQERSDTVMGTTHAPEGARHCRMLGIAQSASPMGAEMAQVGAPLFRRTKRRKKQRR